MVCAIEGAVDHSIYLERMKQDLLAQSTCPKTPCEPVGARDASFQTHLDRVATLKHGIDSGRSTPSLAATACCVTTPQIFYYNDCWLF